MVVNYTERNRKPTSFSSSESTYRSRSSSMSSFTSRIKSTFHEWKLLLFASLALGTGILILGIVFVVKRNGTDGTRACVVTSGYECADIGTSILNKGGNAIEAAIATLFCEGIAMPQSMGLGGGFIMTVYNRTSKKAWTLNARETAPAAASTNMFIGSTPQDAQRGGKSVAVPGELRGYWYLYKNYGKNVPWKDLVQPTIDLCKSGITVTTFIAGRLQSNKNLLYADPVLRDIFFDPKTNDTYIVGQKVKRLRLAKTLEIIAKEGGDALHDGSLTKPFIEDIKKAGGIVTVQDLNNYRVVREDSLDVTLSNGYVIYSPPLPGGGLVLSFILRLLDTFINKLDPNQVVTNQRIVESFKLGYGKKTHFGDPKFVNITEFVRQVKSDSYIKNMRLKIKDNITYQNPEYYGAVSPVKSDHGTAHISILDKVGNAVSFTSTINRVFGAGFASDSTGIILNDEMGDFSKPSMPNEIQPGKRPISSMNPSVIVDKVGDVAMVVGAAGGAKITTAVALTIIRALWYNMDIKSAVYEKRLHHQLTPMSIEFDDDYKTEAQEIVEGLHKIGHNYTFGGTDTGFAAVTAITRKRLSNDQISIVGSFDKRRSGSVSYS